MKTKILMFVIGLLAMSFSIEAQEYSFSVKVNHDSLLMGNQLKVTFSLANAQGSDFVAPEFEGFEVVSGPNMSSSMQVVNGAVSQSVSYTYYLKPIEPGVFFVGPASIQVDGQYLETLPIEILVAPNPDGIQQKDLEQRGMDLAMPFDMYGSNPFNFGDFGFPSMEDFFKDAFPNLDSIAIRPPATAPKQPKPKRPITRL